MPRANYVAKLKVDRALRYTLFMPNLYASSKANAVASAHCRSHVS